MPDTIYPGVFVEEITPGARPILGVPTSITAFIGRAAAGPVDEPTLVLSVSEFARVFGGLQADSTLGYAVHQYFLNGGSTALVVRVREPARGAATDAAISGRGLRVARRGLWALDKADLFNLLCIPPLDRNHDIGQRTRERALRYCAGRRAMFLVDPPQSWASVAAVKTGSAALLPRHPNAAVYFPRLRMADPLQGGTLASFAPCGAVAGVMARNDAERGVWKAPAGGTALLRDVAALTHDVTEPENQELNPVGVNCLRRLPPGGPFLVWGARTWAGAGDWKYISTRRLLLFLEESIYRGVRWAVFEPNAIPLWDELRRRVGAFMDGLWRQGALTGSKPEEAYFVRCDAQTTTPADVARGIANLVIGFAPLVPAEFVVRTLPVRTARPSLP